MYLGVFRYVPGLGIFIGDRKCSARCLIWFPRLRGHCIYQIRKKVMLPIIAICYPMIANPRVKTHGCYKANPMNGVKTKNHNLPNFLIRF